MESVRQPTFKINPKFRLTTRYLCVRWHLIDSETLRCEASMEMPDRYVYFEKSTAAVIAQYHDGILDLIYSNITDFENRKIQKWLRELMRDTILRIARDILPKRVRYWETMKGIHGTGVMVKRLRKNVLGYCMSNNHIA